MDQCSDARPDVEVRTPQEVECFGLEGDDDVLERFRRARPWPDRVALFMIVHAATCRSCDLDWEDVRHRGLASGLPAREWLPSFMIWAELVGLAAHWRVSVAEAAALMGWWL